MTVYLASPITQQQAHAANGMPVLISYALRQSWFGRYAPSFDRVLIDSGAYSAHTRGVTIDVSEYGDWADGIRETVDAVAALDSIAGDWKQGWANMEAMPDGLGFPTFHDSDPPEILPELCDAARGRGGWIGVGVQPAERHLRATWLRETLERIPDDLHVHGWACRRYWNTHRRLDSVDSTNWLLESRTVMDACPWLTPAEALDIMVKRYARERRTVRPELTGDLFSEGRA